MEQNKLKIESLFSAIELRLTNSSKLTVSEKNSELEAIAPQITQLERELDHFQMTGFAKYSSAIDLFESRMDSLKKRFGKMKDKGIAYSQINNDVSAIQSHGPTQDIVNLQIAQNNQKLQTGKRAAENMLKMANNMKDEIDQLDDEVLLQKEKLLLVNAQLKSTQSVVNQTKQAVSYFTRSVNDDFYFKIMIGIVAVVLLFVLFLIFGIRIKENRVEQSVHDKLQTETAQADYHEIDEAWFEQKRLELSGRFQGNSLSNSSDHLNVQENIAADSNFEDEDDHDPLPDSDNKNKSQNNQEAENKETNSKSDQKNQVGKEPLSGEIEPQKKREPNISEKRNLLKHELVQRIFTKNFA